MTGTDQIIKMLLDSYRYVLEFDGQEKYGHAITSERAYQHGLEDAIAALTDEYGTPPQVRQHFMAVAKRRKRRPVKKAAPKKIARKKVLKKR